MASLSGFDFLNSPFWLNYTQQRYLSLEEIKYRIQQQEKLTTEWPALSRQLIQYRKIGSIPLFFPSLKLNFWYFPSDSLTQKSNEIETLGNDLLTQINHQPLFKRDFLFDSAIEEAITSAIYEGAHSTRAQAQQLIISGIKPKTKDEWMLVNNFKAMQWVQTHKSEKISPNLILELHRIVTQNTLEGDDTNFSGKFRNDRVYIGTHEGVSFREIEPSLNEAIQLITQNPRNIHPLIKAILLHYFIAYIHPFFDGNGRTARALFYFNSIQNQLDYIQLLSVSAYLKEHGSQYEKTFEKVASNELDITYFISFCLDSIHSALLIVSKKIKYLLEITKLQETYNLSVNQIGLLQRMALHRFRTISIEEYATQINMSREIARQELKMLTELNLVEESKLGKKLVYRIHKPQLNQILNMNLSK